MGVTAEVARFITHIELGSIPAGVRHLACRSILDGVGLAIAGSKSRASLIARDEITRYGDLSADASVLGADLRVPARFAAFLNGLAIHADDFDDTQLAVAADRVYGLLTHPTAPVLPGRYRPGGAGRQVGADMLICVSGRRRGRDQGRRGDRPAPLQRRVPLDGYGRCYRSWRGGCADVGPRSRRRAPCAWASPPRRPPGCARTSAR